MQHFTLKKLNKYLFFICFILKNPIFKHLYYDALLN